MRLLLCIILLVPLLGNKATEDQTMLTSEEIKVVLDRHNYWRADVGVTSKLEWSEEMAELAADWAKELKRKGCGFEHRPDNNLVKTFLKALPGLLMPHTL